MNDSMACPINGETPQEERVNFWTHLAGFFLSIIGCAYLMYWSIYSRDTVHIVSCSIYGTTLMLLYGASAYYHNSKTVTRKRIMQIVDHACIYILIDGSYTPFTLGPLSDSGGWVLLYVVWSIAIVGVVMKILTIHRFRLFSLIAYLVMGWLIVFSFPTLIDRLSLNAMIWLMLGGFSYSFGTLFFLWESLPFNHAIWHLFVLGGSLCHYISIMDLVYAASVI